MIQTADDNTGPVPGWPPESSDIPPDYAPDEGEDDDSLAPGERRCILTRERFPRSRLIRFVLDPDGQVVPDVDERLPGRGLWLSPGRDMIEMAASRRAFSRAARCSVIVPPHLADRVEGLLVQRCLNLLGLARRGGQVVSGFEKVRARLREGSVGVLLSASDGATDGRAKVVALANALVRDTALVRNTGGTEAAIGRPTKDKTGTRVKGLDGRGGNASHRRRPRRTEPMLVTAFTAAELGRPLGRERAVHVALDSGRLATRLLESCRLLTGFRAEPVVQSVSQASPAAHADPDGRDPEQNETP